MSGLTRLELPEFKSEHNRFSYGFFGLNGGVSAGVYSSLNVAFHTDDDPDSVWENRRRIANHLAERHNDLYTVNQVHGNTCLIVEDAFDPKYEAPDADALVTERPYMPIAVMTADCVPILINADKVDGKPVVGAIHAGWKGALGGIIESTLRAVRELGGDISTLKACIGPCIQRKSYEVDASFAQPFLEEDPVSERYFSSGKSEDKFQFDLPGYVTGRLARSGIKQINDCGLDTYTLSNDFFSCRRAQHQVQNDFGRQASVIMIR